MSVRPASALVSSETINEPSLSTEDIRTILSWRDWLIGNLADDAPILPDSLLLLANYLTGLAVRSKRLVDRNMDLCVFCRNNNEPIQHYSTHKVKDRYGRVTCPVLRKFKCPLCGATGDKAHTIRYCPRATGCSLGMVVLSMPQVANCGSSPNSTSSCSSASSSGNSSTRQYRQLLP